MAIRIAILGGPGAGKGTQATRIAAAYNVPHISTGDIFRQHIHDGTAMGRQVQAYLDRGQLAPDRLACGIVGDRLAEPDCAQGFVLDGFPRSQRQAEVLDELLAARGEKLDLVLQIAVSDGEVVERLGARWCCPACGTIYNLRFSPPKQFPYCDGEDCSGVELVQREDDKEDTVRERLRVYHRISMPLLRYYKRQDVLRLVRGENVTPDRLFATIEDLMVSIGLACAS